MSQLTKNSSVSLGVMFAGLFISTAGPFVEPSNSLRVIGQLLIYSGMVQAHFGVAGEFKQSERLRFLVLTIFVVVMGLSCAYLSLQDYPASWPWIVALVIATLFLQLLISFVWMWIWNFSEKIKVRVDRGRSA